MISIVICSRNKELLSKVKENVSATVGVPFEIIAVDDEQIISSVEAF